MERAPIVDWTLARRAAVAAAGDLPRLDEVAPDRTTLLVALAATLVTGLVPQKDVDLFQPIDINKANADMALVLHTSFNRLYNLLRSVKKHPFMLKFVKVC